ncbi:hypothetical protein EBU95_20495, partial [bacterium]|nr:hypothetical protein [bacterium]
GSISSINNVLFNQQLAGAGLYLNSATTGSHFISGNVIIKIGGTTTYGIYSLDLGSTFSDNRVAGTGIGFAFNESADINIFTNNVSHSNSSGGMTFITNATTGGVISNCKFFRNGGSSGGYGLTQLFNTPSTYYDSLCCANCTFFGNGQTTTGNNIIFNTSSAGSTIFDSCSVLKDPVYSTISDLTLQAGVNIYLQVNSSSLLATSTDATITLGATTVNAVFNNCNFPPTLSAVGLGDGYFNGGPLGNGLIPPHFYLPYPADIGNVVFNNLNGANNYVSYTKSGFVYTETRPGYYRTTSPSEGILTLLWTPYKYQKSSSKYVCVNKGDTVTASVWLLNPAIYSGIQSASLVLRANPDMGINTDIVLYSVYNPSGSNWVQFSGTTPAAIKNGVFEFAIYTYVSSAITPGACVIDDWSFS